MKTRFRIALATVATAAAAALISTSLAGAGPGHAHHGKSRKAAPLVVHEWGTFTVMQGSNGVSLDGMQHEQEHLPAFVHSTTSSTESPFRQLGVESRNVPVRKAFNKMETPVLYFHTSKRQHVRVRVGFEGGILNQYYPAPAEQSATPRNASGQVDLDRVARSWAVWDLDVVPRGQGGLKIPSVAAGNLYGFAREARSANVRASTPAGAEDEQFVFYRGLGRTIPDIQLHAGERGWNELVNNTKHEIPRAFILQMKGDRGRFRALGNVKPGATKYADLCVAWKDKEATIASLGPMVQKALVAQGLHEDEARSMVRTWSKSWFGSEGTRVLYIVPPAFVDRVLPLTIEPAPAKLVRTFVGRIEFMTVEEEQRVEQVLAKLGSTTADSPEMRELAKLGRFIEPKVRRIRALTRSVTVRRAAERVLAALKVK